MNASQARHLVAAASSAAALSWTAIASAQSVVVQSPPPAQPAPTVVATPPAQSAPVVVNNQTPTATGPVMAEPPANDADTGDHWRPNRYLLMSGLVLAGVPYIASISVAATSHNGSDGNLYIPAFGPWLDLGQRGGCPSNGDSCAGEVGNKVLLVGDGIFQSVGVLQIIGSFIFPERVTVIRTGKEGGWVGFSPASLGVGGYGMSAMGKF